MDQCDPHNLRRFIEAQLSAYDRALGELRTGCKTSHWIWFIFPQMKGLGYSQASQLYGLGGLEEARAFLAHPTLGARLRESVEAMLACGDSDAASILGVTDAMKFRSSMTLFQRAAPNEPLFAQALAKFFNGEEDARTLEKLGR